MHYQFLPHPTVRTTICIFHGFGGSSATYLNVLDAFAANFSVLAVDLFGHGLSGYNAGIDYLKLDIDQNIYFSYSKS